MIAKSVRSTHLLIAEAGGASGLARLGVDLA